MASPPPPRGPALRQALVQGALDLIEQDGFAAFNLRALATRVGVTQPALYRHFDSREALLEAAMLAGWGAFDAAAVAAAGEDEPYGRLERLGEAYVRFGVEHPGWFRLTFGRRDALAALAHRIDQVPQGQHLALTALARVVPPSTPDFGHAWRAWWGLVHGLTFLSIERVFVLVPDDEGRVQAAAAAVRSHVACLRAARGEPGAPTSLGYAELYGSLRPG